MKYIISALIFILAVAAAIGLYSTSPKTKKMIPEQKVPVVLTAPLEKGREKVSVEAFGTVIPARRITLQSEVEGRILEQNQELVPGGLIKKGEMIVKIDPADYELLVNEYRAELEEATFELDLEQGRQVIAKREWKLLEKEVETSSAGKSLALREPHLRLVKAKVDKAKSRLAAAELALKRTMITAPFNALVLDEFIDKGQLVSNQTSLATLVGTDRFHIQVSVPVNMLNRIALPGGSRRTGSAADIILATPGGGEIVRRGHVLKVMGDLDPEGRMARLLIVIDDPLNLVNKAGSGLNKAAILLGSYLKVRIDAGYFDNVLSVPREALREGNLLWVQDRAGRLRIRDSQVVWRLKDEVLVKAELEDGDRLIVSRLLSPLPGIPVKSADENIGAEQNTGAGR